MAKRNAFVVQDKCAPKQRTCRTHDQRRSGSHFSRIPPITLMTIKNLEL